MSKKKSIKEELDEIVPHSKVKFQNKSTDGIGPVIQSYVDQEVVKQQQQQQQIDENYLKVQFDLIEEFVLAVKSKQLQKLFKISNTKFLEIDGVKYPRKFTSGTQNLILNKLDYEISQEQDPLKRMEKTIELRKKCALFFFGIPDAIADENYEKIQDVLDACLIKAQTGLNTQELDFEKMMEILEQKQYNSILSKNVKK